MDLKQTLITLLGQAFIACIEYNNINMQRSTKCW